AKLQPILWHATPPPYGLTAEYAEYAEEKAEKSQATRGADAGAGTDIAVLRKCLYATTICSAARLPFSVLQGMVIFSGCECRIRRRWTCGVPGVLLQARGRVTLRLSEPPGLARAPRESLTCEGDQPGLPAAARGAAPSRSQPLRWHSCVHGR